MEPQPEEDDLCLGVVAWPPVGTPDPYLKHTRFRENPRGSGIEVREFLEDVTAREAEGRAGHY